MTPQRPIDYLVVGAQGAGLAAASTFKRMRPETRVVIVDREGPPSVSACSLPAFLSGRVPLPESLVVLRPEGIAERGLELRLGWEALAIDPAERSCRIASVQTGGHELLSYRRLLLATGASALRPDVPGRELPGVHVLRSLKDARGILSDLETRQPKSAVVVGGSFVGLAVADALRSRGLAVTVVEGQGCLLAGMAGEASRRLATRMGELGVGLRLGSPARAVMGGREPQGVDTHGGFVAGEMVVFAVGIRPRSELVTAAGGETAAGGAISVNGRQQTSLPWVQAAGDCATSLNRLTGKAVAVGLGTEANRAGRRAGEIAAGASRKDPGHLNTRLGAFFDMEIGWTGLSLEEAREAGFAAEAIDVTHALRGSAFGGGSLWLRLVLDKGNQRILGAQVAGGPGAGWRCGVLATAISAEMTAGELETVDLGYTPELQPLWDAVTLAARRGHRAAGRDRS